MNGLRNVVLYGAVRLFGGDLAGFLPVLGIFGFFRKTRVSGGLPGSGARGRGHWPNFTKNQFFRLEAAFSTYRAWKLVIVA